MSSGLRYSLEKVDERYDRIIEIGYMDNYTYKIMDEPFDMFTSQNWRYDKNIGQWVEGEIDEETGEWKLISS